MSVEELRRLRGDALRLGNTPADAVRSIFPGAYRAIFHGRGLEFDEVRDYQWGDDYRSVDWRVTARTGQMHTKLFHEERERTLYLLIDAGPTMAFGSRVQFKSVLAARIAALFTWLAVECGDRVGALVFGNERRVHIHPPGSGQAGILKMFRLLSDLDPSGTGRSATLGDGLSHLRHLARPGSLVLLVGDMLGMDLAARQNLAHLARHCDLAGIRVFDPLERELPPAGLYPVTDGVNQSILDAHDPAFRRSYEQDFERRSTELRSVFRRYGARLISISTDMALVEGIRNALGPAAGNRGRRKSGQTSWSDARLQR